LNGITVWDGFGQTLLGIIQALAPLLVLFIIFQLTVLKLPRSYIFNLIKGSLLALVGLALFLQGVHIGFFPAGQAIGEMLGSIRFQWLLIPFGFMMGFLATWGEPAVRILGEQVEEASVGSIRKSIVLYTISGGVALFIALGMAKIIFGIPLLWIIIPGYLLAIGMLWFSDKSVIAIAFDAGGVATGPMAVTFLMAIAVGIASSIQGRDPIIDGFGLVALIALAPILTILTLGLILRMKTRRKEEKNMAEMSLIVSIVRKGWGDKILQNSCKAGAEGGTIVFGRGVGVHEKQTILGIPIEPEKEIVLTVTNSDQTDAVLEEIVRSAELGKPGAGIAFVVPVEKVVGVVHRTDETCAI
jgi:nitrogen regulatory protein PII